MRAEEAEAEIAKATLRYAKRQRTWFRHQAEARWFDTPSAAAEAARTFLLSA